MGLWIIQNIYRENNSKYSYPELAKLAESEKQFDGRISVNDKRYLAPESMINEILSELSENGFVNVSFAQLLSAVYNSLAECYAEAIEDLSDITKKTFTSLNIVGGGSRDDYLNRLTKEKTGITVYAGPTECTALGNLIIQMISDGVFESLSEARKTVKNSFDIKTY